MRYPEHKVGRLSLLAAAGLIALTAAACSRSAQQDAVSEIATPKAALPLTTAEAPPSAPAPTVRDLPPAPPARVARLRDEDQRYAYADLGYNMGDAFADAPPDYGFDYDGVEPWVWQSDAGAYQVVEPLPDGDRYYYYQPGDDYPFLVRDPDYAYGFDDGQLVVVYDHYGHALGPDEADRRAGMAGRILLRASALYAAAHHDPHVAVAQDRWTGRRGRLESARQSWHSAQTQDPAWRAYTDAHEQDQRDRWAEERMRRQAETARVDQSLNEPQRAERALAQARSEQTWLQQRRSGQPASGQGGQPAGSPPPRLATVSAPATPPAPQAQGLGSGGPGEHRHMPPPQAGQGQPPISATTGQQQAQTEIQHKGPGRPEAGAHQPPPALASVQTHPAAPQQAMLETQHRAQQQAAAQGHQDGQQQAALEAKRQERQQAAASQQQALLEAQHKERRQQHDAVAVLANQPPKQQPAIEAQHQAQQQAQHAQQQAALEARRQEHQQQHDAGAQAHQAAQQQAALEAQHAQQQAQHAQQQAEHAQQHAQQQALLEAQHKAQQQQQSAAAQAHQAAQQQSAALAQHQAPPHATPPAKPPSKPQHAPPGQPPAKDKKPGQGDDGHP
jgi:hypothetical protein